MRIALCSTGAQLEKLLAGLRKAGSLDDVNARHASRALSWTWARDGSLHVRASLSPEDGALFVAAVEAARDALPAPGDPSAAEPRAATGDHPQHTVHQANADALLVLAETLLASGPAAAPGGARHQVNIHTDLEAILDDVAAHPTPGRIEDGPELHPETLRRLCCDSAAVIVAHHRASGSGRRRGSWMDVGRRTRVVSAALRRAMVLRDRGCRFPGCTQARFVDAHHVVYWSRGGATALDNLVLLCRRHHRYVHEGGYRIVRDGIAGFRFQRPDGQHIPDVPSVQGGDAAALPGLHSAAVTAATAVPAWNGDRLDLAYAVQVLLQPACDASAEASPTPPHGPSLN